jgi:two-component system, chemotaxis family, protein-glutamate methylesterase/glutaminase
MPGHDIIVLGTSAGGLEALKVLVSRLPHDLAAALFVVLHISPESPSALPAILSRSGPLPAKSASDGAAIQHGHIYTAYPDHHLAVEQGYVRLTRGPKENRFRPAIDVLFRSAAYAYGPRVIGVVLSGQLDDGTAGLWAVKDRGGIAVVQDPHEAIYPSMPSAAMRHVAIDYCLPVDDIALLLKRLCEEAAAAEEAYPRSKNLGIEMRIARGRNALDAGVMQLGEPSLYTCPECHGLLLQLQEGGRSRFRCHTGHAFSELSLLAEIMVTIEHDIWSTIRALEESILLLQRLAQHAAERHDTASAAYIQQKAQEARRCADLVRKATPGYESLSRNTEEQPSEIGLTSSDLP